MAFYVESLAQYTMQINGAIFNVELDEQAKTAAIRDYNYKIDDAKFPISNKSRKFDRFDDNRSRTVVIPEIYRTASGKEYTITTIGRAAFAGYQNMDYIVIPRAVTTIEDYAFFRTSLVSVEIPPTVLTMGNRVFGWCTKLKSLKLPQGMTTIGKVRISTSNSITRRICRMSHKSQRKQSQKRIPRPNCRFLLRHQTLMRISLQQVRKTTKRSPSS